MCTDINTCHELGRHRQTGHFHVDPSPRTGCEACDADVSRFGRRPNDHLTPLGVTASIQYCMTGKVDWVLDTYGALILMEASSFCSLSYLPIPLPSTK